MSFSMTPPITSLPFVRRWSDWRTLLFILFFAGQSLYIISTPFSMLTPGLYSLLLISSCLFVFVTCIINHNHQHCPIFRDSTANRILDFLISILILAPASRLHQVHLLNHHKYFKTKDDWTCFETMAQGRGIARILSYVRNSTATMHQNRKLLAAEDPSLASKISQERAFVYVFLLVMLLHNPFHALTLWIPSRVFGLGVLLISNLINHDHCELNSKFNHSRDFLNKIENWFFFNNGYHTAHHASPSTHWQDLPLLHQQRVAKFKDPKYIRNSFFGYLTAMFLHRV